MEAELIVISGDGLGARLGARYSLGFAELRIGRAESCAIRLSDSEVAWEHAAVGHRDGRFHIADRRSGAGTYVNGMRITDHCLEPGDQVSIGETVLIYREGGVELSDNSQHDTLLRACALLFLFRAFALSRSATHRRALEKQILRLVGDLVPCAGGAILLGRDAAELRTAAAEHEGALGFEDIADRLCSEGAVILPDRLTLALALYFRGAVAGALAAWFAPEEAANFEHHRETLSAIATLAASALETAHQVESLQSDNTLLLERIAAGESGIVGESPAILKLLQMIARLAPQDTSVLILGESGTGKELVARALHRQSPRALKPFVAINCAALTESLLESELFGHEKGAFTGAVAQKKGKLEVAEGGTVFLDEIGELALTLQAKLLRVLQQREFEHVGGTRTLRLDVRLVAATNRDLQAEVRSGKFREDLYHRLNVVTLRVPALRERASDIPTLARYFLDRTAARCRRRVATISPEAERYLDGYGWPGNVRELENAIERAVVLGQSDAVLSEDLPETILESAGLPEASGALQSTLTQSKRQSILAAWQQAGGDHNQAAALLNIHPNSLRRLIRSLNLRDALD